ncbi:hypothetical protein BGZ65_011525, partial [Modicella reniformis]
MAIAEWRSSKHLESRHNHMHSREGNISGGQDSEDHIHQMKGYESERMSVPEPHRPISMKRRKVSDEEEDEENDSYDAYSESSSQHSDDDLPSNSRPGRSDMVDFASTGTEASTPSSTRMSSQQQQQQQQQQPSSCPARKRRSILANSSSKFSFSGEMDLLPFNKNNDNNSKSDIDTSSLSLLSATSAIVSEGGHVIHADTVKKQPASSSSFCRHLQYCFPLLGACRKRNFEDAIELTRPLGNDPSVEFLGWFGSIKRRKIHHFPTRWTSALSPSPYVKLMAMRDFWDVMRSRLDLSWLDLWTITASRWEGFHHQVEAMHGTDLVKGDNDTNSTGSIKEEETMKKNNTTTTTITTSGCMNSSMKSNVSKETFSMLTLGESGSKSPSQCDENVDDAEGEWWSTMPMKTRRKTVVQHPNTGLILRGLWEEEERSRRQRQMIPDNVHKPMRSKILNRKPIPRSKIVRNQSTSWIKPRAGTTGSCSSGNMASSSSSSSSASPETLEGTSGSGDLKTNSSTSSKADSDMSSSQQSQAEQELILRKKPTGTGRSNVLSEGYDLNEYKPWRDGTITPHRGCIRSLCQMRNTMLEPWPKEESRAKDECTRILHRMREQLNVVINLQ